MLDSPATNSAQHGEISCALAGHGAVNTSTRARMTARNLWPSIQFLVLFSRSANLFITFLPSPLLVLQQLFQNNPGCPQLHCLDEFVLIVGSGENNHTGFVLDRKSTRLNSSHLGISYAV